jgi:hypothetical protein
VDAQLALEDEEALGLRRMDVRGTHVAGRREALEQRVCAAGGLPVDVDPHEGVEEPDGLLGHEALDSVGVDVR